MHSRIPSFVRPVLSLLFLLILPFLPVFSQTTMPVLPQEEEEEFMEGTASDAIRAEINASPCSSALSVTLDKVDYESFSRLTIRSSEVIPQLRLRNKLSGKEKYAPAAAENIDLDVPPGNYEVVGINRCGEEEVLQEIQTHIPSNGTPVTLSRNLYNTLVEWQRDNEDKDLYQYIADKERLSTTEKLSLIQLAIFQGKPFSDKLALTKSMLPPNPFNKKQSGAKSVTDCQCNTFQISARQNVDPISNIQSNGKINGRYGGWEDDEQTRNNLKIWSAYGFEGPAKYQQLWGDTKSCVNAPYSWGWNLGNSGVPGQSVEPDDLVQPYIAKIEYNNVCISNQGYATADCACEREINFEYQYHSVVRTQANIEGGGTFCGSDRRARAAAYDFATVAIAKANEAGTYQTLRVMANSETSECSQSWTGPDVGDFANFAFQVYRLVMGVQEDEFGNPTVSPGQQDTWDNILVQDVINAAQPIFNGPWITRTPCGGSVVGTEGQITAGQYRHYLKANEPIVFSLSSGSHLSVYGLRKWNANARVHSSFRLASVAKGGYNNSYGDHCCFPGVGTFMLSCVSGDTPVGPSTASWQSASQGFLASYGVYTTINGDEEFGHAFSSPPSGCYDNTVIVPRDKEDGNNPIISPALDESWLNLADTGFNFEGRANFKSFSVYDATGRLIIPNQPINTFNHRELVHGTQSGKFAAGVHVILFRRPDGTTESRKLMIQ